MKTAVITGANTGMGLSTSLVLANSGMHVVLLCRNKERGEEALAYINREKKNGSASLVLCDLGSLKSVRQAAAELQNEYQTIDVLINNAGVVSATRQETEDGFELMIGVNHLGHFLLTNLLLEQVKRSEDGRVIVVSSGANEWGKFYLDDPHLHLNFDLLKGYGQSKLCNLLFANELARRLSDSSVLVFSLHPGAVSTSLGEKRGENGGIARIAHAILRPFFLTPREGADTAIYLALSEKVKEKSGHYFIKRKTAKHNALASDQELAKQCWEWSSKQTRLNEG